MFNKFGKFMQGRYGPDTLTYVLIFAAAIIMYIPFVGIISYPMIGYALFRVFSKDTAKRYAELQKFNHATRGIRGRFRNISIKAAQRASVLEKRTKQRKTHKFLKCPKCKNMLKLPKGKGKLQVTCPVCKNQFYKKT